MVDISKLSIQEIHERFIEEAEPVSGQLLARIQKDPRAGVRRIYQILRKKKEEDKEEQLRLDSLLNFERLLWRSGIRYIAGVDEVGVGPLAGPVVAAAVVFAPTVKIVGMDDSKKLDPAQRLKIAAQIREQAEGIGIGMAEVCEIDELNIYHAGILAMRRAVTNLPVQPDHILTDAREIPEIAVPQNRFNRGDGLNFSIAAASVIAKIHRDRLMEELDRQYPEYGFKHHKGYSTPEHQVAIRKFGPSPVHRKSFTFIQELCGEYSGFFYELKNRLYSAATREAMCEFEKELKSAQKRLSVIEQHKLKLLLTRRWKNL